MWGLYVDHSSYAVGHMCNLGGHICSEAYANNVKCMFTITCGHIIDCSEFIWDMCMQV